MRQASDEASPSASIVIAEQNVHTNFSSVKIMLLLVLDEAIRQLNVSLD